jgi:asparagine synthase (glutamine-hydrolysing)
MEFFNNLKPLSVFEMVRQFFVKKHLPVLFRRLDFSLMHSGIEGREPLASLELYKLALKFNPADLFKNSVGKYPLRYVATKLINKEFAFRSKVGFPVDLKEVFYGSISQNRAENYSIWCNKNLEKIL